MYYAYIFKFYGIDDTPKKSKKSKTNNKKQKRIPGETER